MAKEKEAQEQPEQEIVEPEVAPQGLLQVEFTKDQHGYARGTVTHFSAREALALEKQGVAKVLGELEPKTHKLLAPANKK